jgi:hypothetical protein
MATQQEMDLNNYTSWLGWIDNKLSSGKAWDKKPSNLDKLGAPFMLQDRTWGEIYQDIRKGYLDNGGTEKDMATFAPYTVQHQAEKKAEADKAASATNNGNPNTVTNDYSKYNLDGNGVTRNGGAVVFVPTKQANGDIQPQEYTSMTTARNIFMADYQTPEAFNALMKQLVAKNIIKQSDVDNGQWTQGVDKLIRDYSYKVVSDATYNKNAKPVDIKGFLSGYTNSSGAGNVSRNLSTRVEAKQILDGYLTDLLGRPGTKEEEEEFYKKLHAEEFSATRVSNGTGTSTGAGQLSQAETMLIAAGVAKKALAGTDVEQLINTSSTAATDIAKLQEYASSYGVNMSAADALKYVAAGIGQQNYLAKQEERIKQTAIVLHPQLKDHILAGGTVKDIADQYAYAKAKKLGVAVPVSTADKDVMDAVSKGISVTDFGTAMQARPEWRTTAEAHASVNNLINNIAEKWGLG